MLHRFRTRFLVALTVGALTAGVLLAADGDASKPARGTHVKVERRDGTSFDAHLVGTVKMKTEFGSQEVEGSHLRRIGFRPPGEDRATDTVELTDKSQLRGRIEGPTMQFVIDDKVTEVPTDGLRELKVIGERSASLLAVLAGLLTLTAMEIVLGIDNIVFLAIIAGRLPPAQQPRARKLGLAAALGTRLLLLATLSFLLGLTKPLFTLPDLPLMHNLEAREVSLRDLILLIGGMFLIGKSVMEVHEKFEAAKETEKKAPAPTASFIKVLVQIALIDIIFSLDSVITAVGMVDELWVMVTAMVLAMLVMLVFAGTIADYVNRHPTLKILALSFLILIGVLLVAESLGQHIDKGYIYFAMAFAVVIEMINLRLKGGHAAPAGTAPTA